MKTTALILNKNIVCYLLPGCLVALGILLLGFGLTVNALTWKVIENTGLAVSNGMPIKSVINPIIGVIASGYIVNVPVWVTKVSVITGSVFVYMGTYFIIARYKKIPIKSVFTLAYWRHFDMSIAYKPIKKGSK